MKAPENRIVRPTLRCLIDDLGNDVGPVELRAALAAAEHLVLDKANMLAGDATAEREPIEAITDRSTVKVKTSDRRGALWQDDDGTWWLLAAGRREAAGPGDFYREIAR